MKSRAFRETRKSTSVLSPKSKKSLKKADPSSTKYDQSITFFIFMINSPIKHITFMCNSRIFSKLKYFYRKETITKKTYFKLG